MREGSEEEEEEDGEEEETGETQRGKALVLCAVFGMLWAEKGKAMPLIHWKAVLPRVREERRE